MFERNEPHRIWLQRSHTVWIPRAQQWPIVEIASALHTCWRWWFSCDLWFDFEPERKWWALIPSKSIVWLWTMVDRCGTRHHRHTFHWMKYCRDQSGMCSSICTVVNRSTIYSATFRLPFLSIVYPKPLDLSMGLKNGNEIQKWFPIQKPFQIWK